MPARDKTEPNVDVSCVIEECLTSTLNIIRVRKILSKNISETNRSFIQRIRLSTMFTECLAFNRLSSLISIMEGSLNFHSTLKKMVDSSKMDENGIFVRLESIIKETVAISSTCLRLTRVPPFKGDNRLRATRR